MFDYKTLKGTLIKHTGHLFLSNTSVAAINFIINMMLVRQLGAHNNGLIVLTITISSMISLFIDLRFGETLIKYIGDFIAQNRKDLALGIVYLGYLIDLILGIFSCLILFFGRHLFADLFHQPQIKSLLVIYATMLLIITVNTTSTNLFQAFREFTWVSIQTVLTKIFDLAAVCIALMLNKDAEGILYAYLFSSILFTVIITIQAQRYIRKVFDGIKPSWRDIPVREIIHFTFHTTFSSTLKSLNRYMDVLILGYFKDPRGVTYYKNGLGLAGIFGMVSDPIYKVLFPVMVSLRNARDTQTIKKIAKKVILFSLLLGIPVGLIITWLAPYLITWFYHGMSDPSVTVLRIAIWIQVVNLMLCWQRPICLAYGRSDIGSKVGFFSFLIFIALLLILVPHYAHIGAVIAYGLLTLINLSVVFLFTLKILKRASTENTLAQTT